MLASEELEITAARITALCARDDEIEAILQYRGDPQRRARRFDAVINCSGPTGDVAQSTDPLLKDLLKQGLAVPAALGLGLAVDLKSRLIDGRMLAHSRLFAIGPLTRSLFWEASAVPDLREHAVAIARSAIETLQLPHEYRTTLQSNATSPLTVEYR
jgi:uncharacterized NAD(P)/FAD-binding protein YdhS